MTNILYCGHMKSPFIADDCNYLGNGNNVTVFDLAQFASTFWQIPSFVVRCFTKVLPGVIRNDIVWIWGADYPAIPFIILSKLFKKKVVVCIYGVEVYPPNGIKYGFRSQGFRGKISKMIIENVDMNLVMSWDYLVYIREYSPDTPVIIVPGCVDVSKYQPDYSVKEEVAVTAYCNYNMVQDIKGISTFRAASKISNVKMVEIVNRSHKTQIDTFLKSKVYCQLSFAESFGMSLLEAMACGCVPVVSDRDWLPYIVRVCGVVVPYGNAVATAEGIALASKMDGENARAKAAEYSIKRRTEALDRIIKLVG